MNIDSVVAVLRHNNSYKSMVDYLAFASVGYYYVVRAASALEVAASTVGPWKEQVALRRKVLVTSGAKRESRMGRTEGECEASLPVSVAGG